MELQRTQVAPEADAFTFAQIAGYTDVTTVSESYVNADAKNVLEDLRAVTSAMDEDQVSTGSRIRHHGKRGLLVQRVRQPGRRVRLRESVGRDEHGADVHVLGDNLGVRLHQRDHELGVDVLRV